MTVRLPLCALTTVHWAPAAINSALMSEMGEAATMLPPIVPPLRTCTRLKARHLAQSCMYAAKGLWLG